MILRKAKTEAEKEAEKDAEDYKKIRDIFLHFEDEGLVQGNDRSFYTKEEWADRGEDYCNDSPIVMCFEGDWYMKFNYHDPDSHQIMEQVSERLKEIGYYYEQGHAWNCGFYLID